MDLRNAVYHTSVEQAKAIILLRKNVWCHEWTEHDLSTHCYKVATETVVRFAGVTTMSRKFCIMSRCLAHG